MEIQYIFADQKSKILDALVVEYPFGIDEFAFTDLVAQKIPEFDSAETREFINYLQFFKKIYLYYTKSGVAIIFKDGHEPREIHALEALEKIPVAA